MLEAFRGGVWHPAADLIGECRAVGIVALEAYYDVFAARIAEYRDDPPGEDWDGVFVARSK